MSSEKIVVSARYFRKLVVVNAIIWMPIKGCRALYPHWLEEMSDRYQCVIHGDALTTNRIHFLVKPQDMGEARRMMQYIVRSYVTFNNHTYGNSESSR